MDIALLFINGTLETDVSLNNGDLLASQDLATAMILSLFTDRRANDDDLIENDDKRGFWGDTFPAAENDQIGSRLWLLSREKTTQTVINRAREYVIEATQWLLEDQVAQAVNVDVELLRMGVIGIHIEVIKPSGSQTFHYQYAWRQAEHAVSASHA